MSNAVCAKKRLLPLIGGNCGPLGTPPLRFCSADPLPTFDYPPAKKLSKSLTNPFPKNVYTDAQYLFGVIAVNRWWSRSETGGAFCCQPEEQRQTDNR